MGVVGAITDMQIFLSHCFFTQHLEKELQWECYLQRCNDGICGGRVCQTRTKLSGSPSTKRDKSLAVLEDLYTQR